MSPLITQKSPVRAIFYSPVSNFNSGVCFLCVREEFQYRLGGDGIVHCHSILSATCHNSDELSRWIEHRSTGVTHCDGSGDHHKTATADLPLRIADNPVNDAKSLAFAVAYNADFLSGLDFAPRKRKRFCAGCFLAIKQCKVRDRIDIYRLWKAFPADVCRRLSYRRSF